MMKKKNPRIAIISPASPYRGGIATHSNQLFKELNKSLPVKIFNYHRQYPQFFFPGKTQYEKSPEITHDRVVDTVNFFSWSSTAKKILEFNPNLVLFRYWHPFFAITLRSIAKKIKKLDRSCRLVALIDNIIPHERFFFDSVFSSMFLSSMDGYLVQSSQVELDLLKLVKNPKYVKALHPFYNHYPLKINTFEAKASIGIDARTKVFLFFGLIRPYKGLDIFLNSIKFLEKEVSDYTVLVAGEAYEDIAKYKNIVPEKLMSRVIWKNNYIDEKDIATYFSASDVLVLPYKSCTQSGVVQVGYHYGLPAVASNIKGFQDYVIEGQTGYLFDSQSSEDLASKIVDVLRLSPQTVQKGINLFHRQCTWDFFSRKIIDFYENY